MGEEKLSDNTIAKLGLMIEEAGIQATVAISSVIDTMAGRSEKIPQVLLDALQDSVQIIKTGDGIIFSRHDASQQVR